MTAVFVDTMGWFSLLDTMDEWHADAKALMQTLKQSRTPLMTTDYVIDETATLLKIRRAGRAIHGLFTMLETSLALTLTRIDAERFQASQDYYVKHLDHDYSFTDVTSFIVMCELQITDAFTHDDHFTEAGFVRMLA
jgi:predicted nucleic acid-binding protein